jgi:hypothetical protein
VMTELQKLCKFCQVFILCGGGHNVQQNDFCVNFVFSFQFNNKITVKHILSKYSGLCSLVPATQHVVGLNNEEANV